MSDDDTPKHFKMKMLGWLLSGLIVALLCLASASGKFVDFEGKAEMFDHLGWSTDVMVNIGVVEILVAVLFLIPRTAFIAAILLTGYLGGATATHVRVGDPFFVPIIMGILVWVALGLRDRRVFQMAFRTRSTTTI